MKYLLALVLALHGLIHLMGFAKAFNLASFEQLRAPIGQPAGLLWLAAALLLLAGAVMLFVAPGWWWAPALCGVALSQLLIVMAWGDAKFGTLANLIVLAPALVAALGHAPWGFRAQYERDVAAALAAPAPAAAPVTEADIAHLPAAVQRYLRFAGAVGRPRVESYRVRFRGALRNGPEDGWMPIVADQQSVVHDAERLFIVDAAMYGVPATAYHRYIGDSAVFEVKIASLLKIVDARGPEMDQSETVTLFNDMCLLAPATLIDPAIRWEELDPQTVRATFTNAGHTIAAVLSFDPSGALVNFVSDDRSRTVDGKAYEHVRWSTPVTAWHSFDGRRVPDGEAHWQLPGGEFAYGRMAIEQIAYNVPAR
jgi:hypothetical protein